MGSYKSSWIHNQTHMTEEAIFSYAYYANPARQWLPLQTWGRRDLLTSNPSSLKKKECLLKFCLDEKSTMIVITCKENSSWVGFIEPRTNIHQSSKKFLQFSDKTDVYSARYGLGFDTAEEANNCVCVLEYMKKELMSRRRELTVSQEARDIFRGRDRKKKQKPAVSPYPFKKTTCT